MLDPVTIGIKESSRGHRATLLLLTLLLTACSAGTVTAPSPFTSASLYGFSDHGHHGTTTWTVHLKRDGCYERSWNDPMINGVATVRSCLPADQAAEWFARLDRIQLDVAWVRADYVRASADDDRVLVARLGTSHQQRPTPTPEHALTMLQLSDELDKLTTNHWQDAGPSHETAGPLGFSVFAIEIVVPAGTYSASLGPQGGWRCVVPASSSGQYDFDNDEATTGGQISAKEAHAITRMAFEGLDLSGAVSATPSEPVVVRLYSQHSSDARFLPTEMARTVAERWETLAGRVSKECAVPERGD